MQLVYNITLDRILPMKFYTDWICLFSSLTKIDSATKKQLLRSLLTLPKSHERKITAQLL